MKRQLQTWETIKETFQGNPFLVFQTELTSLNITTNEAMVWFSLHYDPALTSYNRDEILAIFNMVKATNWKKYQKLIAAFSATYDPIQNYNMTETSNDKRSPNFTSTTSGTTATDNTVKNNQSRMTTDVPEGVQEVSTSSVNPYDNSGFRDERQNVTTQTGSRTTTESYSGNADTSQSNSTVNSTTSQTGEETYTHSLTRQGNIGVTTNQQMLESEISLANKMNIFKIIELDLAEQLFLKVW